jgi:hypothetical protein
MGKRKTQSLKVNHLFKKGRLAAFFIPFNNDCFVKFLLPSLNSLTAFKNPTKNNVYSDKHAISEVYFTKVCCGLFLKQRSSFTALAIN